MVKSLIVFSDISLTNKQMRLVYQFKNFMLFNPSFKLLQRQEHCKNDRFSYYTLNTPTVLLKDRITATFCRPKPGWKMIC